MVTGRYYDTATPLSNGLVLFVGGYDSNDSQLASAELYDPASGTFTSTGTMTVARSAHTTTLLPNGTVLITSGDNNDTIQVYASAELYEQPSGSPIRSHAC
jgi:sugar (pentulose or hexulose) kinase